METPKLSHLQFLALSALVDGQPKRPTEILQAIDWRGKPPGVYAALRCLHRDDLVRKAAASFQNGDAGTLYEITPAGSRVWREQLDWYGFIASRFGQPADESERPGVVDKRSVAPCVPRRRQRYRLPNNEETGRILDNCSDHFARFYRALGHGRLSRDQLIGLEIENVDLAAGVLRLPGPRGRVREVRIDRTLSAILREAIGHRERGHVFVTRHGGPWSINGLDLSFSRARGRAGLPAEIKLCGSGRGLRRGWREIQ